MTLSLTLRVMTGLRCSVCDRLMNSETHEENMIDVAMFGIADPYAVCPNCFAPTSAADQADQEFRRRSRVMYFTRWNRVLRS